MGRSADQKVEHNGHLMDWRFAQALRGVEEAFGQKVLLSQRPGGNRTSSGHREWWKTTLPSVGQREEAKEKTLAPKSKKLLLASCPGCEKDYLMLPSEYISVRDNGLCKMCTLWEQGLFEGVVAIRPPTLEESLAAANNDIRSAEALVIKQAYLSGQLVKKKGKGKRADGL